MVEQPVGSIVVGVDGSSKDLLAVRWAARDAALRGTGLHILHAYPWVLSAREYGQPPPPDVLESAAEVLDPLVAAVHEEHPDLPVSTEVLMEQPSVALVRASERAPMIVMGARGLGPLRSRLLGSTSQKVAAHAAGTVVVVRDEPPHPDGPVVVGVDPGSSPPQILQMAFEEAAAREVGVVMVHASYRQYVGGDVVADQRVQEALDRIATEEAAELRALAKEWRGRYPGVEVEVRQVEEHPIDALVHAAGEGSLLVVGSRGERGLARLRLGSVSRGVLYAAPVVAVVRVHARTVAA